jgi:hypothetical protein
MKIYQKLLLYGIIFLCVTRLSADIRFCNRSAEKIDVDVKIPSTQLLNWSTVLTLGLARRCTGLEEKFNLMPGEHHDIKTDCWDLIGGGLRASGDPVKNSIKINGEDGCYIYYRSPSRANIVGYNITVLLYRYDGKHRENCKNKWSWNITPEIVNCKSVDLEVADKMMTEQPRKKHYRRLIS